MKIFKKFNALLTLSTLLATLSACSSLPKHTAHEDEATHESHRPIDRKQFLPSDRRKK